MIGIDLEHILRANCQQYAATCILDFRFLGVDSWAWTAGLGFLACDFWVWIPELRILRFGVKDSLSQARMPGDELGA